MKSQGGDVCTLCKKAWKNHHSKILLLPFTSMIMVIIILELWKRFHLKKKRGAVER